MPYAINLCDYITHGKDDLGLKLLLAPVISETIVETDAKLVDHGGALLMNCDDERGEAIVKLIRMKYPRGCRYYLRIYQSKTGNGSWRQV